MRDSTAKRKFYTVILLATSLSLTQTALGDEERNPVASLSSQTGSSAKPSDYGPYYLGEVVAGAGEDDAGAGAITNQVSAERIEETNSRTIPEALRYTPGVTVYTGRKNQPDVSIHGFDQSKVLVLIDGVPYYETNYGKLNLTQLLTESVAEIQVVKGVPSVLYGANTLGGVINIISKQAEGKPYFSATGEAGEKDYYLFAASHGMKKGILSYWIDYTHMEREAWKLSDDFDSVVGETVYKPGGTVEEVLEDGGFRDNSQLRTDNLWAKIGLQPGPASEYFLNFHLIDSSWGLPASIYSNTVFPGDPAFSQYAKMRKYDDWGVDLSGRQEISEELSLKLNLFYHEHRDTYASYYEPELTTLLSDSTYKDHLEGGAFFADYTPAYWQTLRLAVHYRGDTHKQQDDSYLPYATSRSTLGSVAVESESQLPENLALTIGCGYNFFDVTSAEAVETDKSGNYEETVDLDTPSTQDSVTPMAGLVWRPTEQTSVFTSTSLTSRFPTLQQLYASKSGNLNLDPEQSVNFVAGVRQRLGSRIRGEVSFFNHYVHNWISRENRDYQYRNWGTITMTGLEAGVFVDPFEGLTLNADYTLNYARDHSSDRVTSDVVRIPLSKIDLGLAYILPEIKTRINLDATYLSPIYTQLPSPASPDLEKEKSDDYFLLGGRLTQPITEYGEIYLAVENIFDLDYEPDYGFPAAGRTFWVGAEAVY